MELLDLFPQYMTTKRNIVFVENQRWMDEKSLKGAVSC